MVLVSYSHLDKECLRRFQTVFKPLRRYAEVDLWADDRIKPSEQWRDKINQAMENASVASVNYILYGIMFQICNKSSQSMGASIVSYKVFTNGLKAFLLIPNPTVGGDLLWAFAGFNGWTPGGNTPGSDTPQCKICNTTESRLTGHAGRLANGNEWAF